MRNMHVAIARAALIPPPFCSRLGARKRWIPEIGAKTSFRTDSVRGYFNVAAFYNDFSDQQLNMNGIALTTPGPGFVPACRVAGAW